MTIEQRYNDLMDDVSNHPYYTDKDPGGMNVYTCSKGHETKTIDLDIGVTPFMHKCSVCNELGKSSFYKKSRPNLPVSGEWYRPSLDEIKTIHSEHVLNHVFQGGLLYREINKNQ